MSDHIRPLVDALLSWYDTHARDLPWRATKDPYRIWLSEIMLQQTQVATTIPYYERFLKEAPSIETLAALPDDRLYKLWEGLGYYSRAKNLKKAAIEVLNRWDGALPERYSDLLTLPGIGPYTAGAIASIAFGERVPAIDGNVLRILSRLYAEDVPVNTSSSRTHYAPLADRLVPAHRPGDFNQALMDLGAGICLSGQRKPLCDHCPLALFCAAKKRNLTHLLPVRTARPARRIEKRTILVVTSGEKALLQAPPDKGLLANLWTFPNLDRPLAASEASEYIEHEGGHCQSIEDWGASTHLFTHLRWELTGYHIAVASPWPDAPGEWVDVSALTERYPMSTALRTYRDKLLSEHGF